MLILASKTSKIVLLVFKMSKICYSRHPKLENNVFFVFIQLHFNKKYRLRLTKLVKCFFQLSNLQKNVDKNGIFAVISFKKRVFLAPNIDKILPLSVSRSKVLSNNYNSTGCVRLKVRDIEDNLILVVSLFCLNNRSWRCLHYHKLPCGYDCFHFARTQFGDFERR